MNQRDRKQAYRFGFFEPSFGPMPGDLFDNNGQRIRVGYREISDSHLFGKRKFGYHVELSEGIYWHINIGGLQRLVVSNKGVEGQDTYFRLDCDRGVPRNLNGVPEIVAGILGKRAGTSYLEWRLETLAPDFNREKLNRGLLAGSTPISVSFYRGNPEAMEIMDSTYYRIAEFVGGIHLKRTQSGNFTHIYANYGSLRETEWGKHYNQEEKAREALLREGLLIRDEMLTCFPLPDTSE